MKYRIYLSAWVSSLRLKTLPLAISAILVGNVLAYWQKQFDWLIMLLCITTAALLQILANLANDYGDTIKGVDKPDRIGPKRGIQHHLITIKQLSIALMINVILVVILGLILLVIANLNRSVFWLFIMLGLLSIIAAITYTMGNKPYGYNGLGDISVLLFFGIISVIGSYYLQTKILSLSIIFPAIACGFLSVAVLNINNLRDRQSDRMNNKKTLIVFIGDKWGRYYHIILLIVAMLLFNYFNYNYLSNPWNSLCLFIIPFFYLICCRVLKAKRAYEFAALFLPMIKLSLITNLLFCVGVLLS
ncbi:1,4-dihydroxy-2-naphthoate polyprenyltransferase [Utexia brackfieldae]|uniref:1,4-dihydroxy-2-naphthoate polyprenyltransferase n=1 Tax=Utexia brackfieldae TaxID=3074108 RepID=UPI00370D6000